MSASESLTVAHLQAAVPDTGASLRLAGLGGEVLLQMFDWWTSPPRHPSRSASITQ